ncbi:MAG: transposase [Anaerolineae bacterium]|nr:transposase [Anaerolineae bacterium]
MPNVRRYYVPDAIVFITGVTRHRTPHLASKRDLDLFWDTLRRVQAIHPFHLLAYVILPDHFHWLMQVDDECGNFSKVLHSVKRNCTLNFKKAHGITGSFSLWQDRFWDHVIRDERDLEDHVDYVHWNPVKHGYVLHPEDWAQSTFLHWRDRGYYDLDWGVVGEPSNLVDMQLE